MVDVECLKVEQIEAGWRKQVKRVGGLLLFNDVAIIIYQRVGWFLGRGCLFLLYLFNFSLDLWSDSFGCKFNFTSNTNVSGKSKNAS